MGEIWNGHHLEITEMTDEDFEAFIEDRRICGHCDECYCLQHLTLNGEELCGCSEKSASVMQFLLDKTKYIESCAKELCKSHDEPKQNIELYSTTRNFMKQRGYTKCYMCGSNLEDE